MATLKQKTPFTERQNFKKIKQCICLLYQRLNLINFLGLYCNEYLRTAGITSTIFCVPKQTLNWDLKDLEDVHNCMQSGALWNMVPQKPCHADRLLFPVLVWCFSPFHWNGTLELQAHGVHTQPKSWILMRSEWHIVICNLPNIWDTDVFRFHFHDNICKRNRKLSQVKLFRVLINTEVNFWLEIC